MRTKTLLLTAAVCAAGVATSMAQVFSANVVGYVNKVYTTGLHIAANPLSNGTNTAATLFANPPLFSQIYKFSGGAFESANTFGFGGWGNPNQTLNPGEGFFLNLPAPGFTNTYVGEVLQGNLTNTIPVGFAMIGSQVPQAGTLQGTLGLTPQLFDQVFQWDVAAQTYQNANTFGFGGWGNGDPNITVAEGFFYNNAQATANQWTRTFNVN